jgi:cell division protease FtsH
VGGTAGGAAAQPSPTPSPAPSPTAQAPSRAPAGAGTYWVAYPSSDALTALVAESVTAAGARVTVDPQSTKRAISAVTTFLLPLMVLANLFGLLFSVSRGGGSGIGEVMMFGTIGSRRVRGGAAKSVTFDSVAGADEAVAELREVRD